MMSSTDAAGLTAVIVDDSPAVRAGVAHWLSAGTPSIKVVADGEDPRVAWLGEGASADVVILDLNLGGLAPALGDLRRLVEAGRRVVVYSMCTDEGIAMRCLELGALSYLSKVERARHLVEAVHAAAWNQPYAPRAGAHAAERSKRLPGLSTREIEVLIEWIRAESKEFVAQRLGISPSTVNSHLERIRIKYAEIGREASTKVALAARAIQDGLIGVDDL